MVPGCSRGLRCDGPRGADGSCDYSNRGEGCGSDDLGACLSNPQTCVRVAVGPDARRRDAGDVVPSPRSGNTADGPTPPLTLWAHGGCGRTRRCSSSLMTWHRLLLSSPSAPRKTQARKTVDYSDKLLGITAPTRDSRFARKGRAEDLIKCPHLELLHPLAVREVLAERTRAGGGALETADDADLDRAQSLWIRIEEPP